MWILPTRGRPDLAQRVFSLAPPTAPGVMVVDEDQVDAYSAVSLPIGWQRLVLPRLYLAEKLNATVERFPGAGFYGIVNDDMLPASPAWDITLPLVADRWKIAWADDELNGRIGAAAFGGDLVRALGWLAPPALKHFYIDDAHELVAHDLGIGRPMMNVKIAHLHFSTGKAAYDRTYKDRPNIGTDKVAFDHWKSEEWPAEKARLRALIR